jgi:type I restriction enzyme S subunit
MNDFYTAFKSQNQPKEWFVDQLVDACELITCGVAARPDYVDVDGVPFLSSLNVKQGRVIWAGYKSISKEDHTELTRNNKPVKGDILYTRVGSFGEAAVVERDIDFSVFVSLTLIKPKAEIVHNYFLKFLLNSLEVKALANNTTTGLGVQNLNVSEVRRFELPFPPLPEQIKIAQILTSVDDVIEKTQAQIDKLKDLKTGMMQELLTKGIGHVEFKDSPVGRIPVGWEVKTLGHISSLQRGHDLTRAQMVDGPYPIVSSSGFNGMNHEYTTKGPGVVVGRKGSIGRVHFLESDYWAHDTSLYVTNFFGNNVRYVYYLFLYMDLQQYGTKSGSPSLNRNDIHPLKVALPTIDEQQKIQAILSNIDMSISLLTNKKEKINNTKKALMQDLLTGKVRVNTGLSNSSLAVG